MSAINHVYQNRANISQQWTEGKRAAVAGKVTAVVLELAAITAVGFAIAGLLSAGPLACLGNYGYAVIAGGVVLEIAIGCILHKYGKSSTTSEDFGASEGGKYLAANQRLNGTWGNNAIGDDQL